MNNNLSKVARIERERIAKAIIEVLDSEEIRTRIQLDERVASLVTRTSCRALSIREVSDDNEEAYSLEDTLFRVVYNKILRDARNEL